MPSSQGNEEKYVRSQIYFLALVAIGISFMQRSDINIAITKIVNSSEKQLGCYESKKVVSLFNWSTRKQYILLGAFYWPYWLTQVVGAWGAHKFGTKLIVGSAQLICACISLVFPVVIQNSFSFAVLLRLIAGFVSGLTWPSMYAIIAHWVPLESRGKFVSSFQAQSLGIGISYLFGGLLLDKYYWTAMFYISSGFGFAFCIAWKIFVYNTPEEHPKLTSYELYLVKERKTVTFPSLYRRSIPWIAIGCTCPVWAVAIASFGQVWFYYFFAIYLPLYLSNIMGFSDLLVGVFSGAPFILNYLFGIFCVFVSDAMIEKKILFTGAVRHIFTAIGQVIPALGILAVYFLGCRRIIILICITSSVVIASAIGSGSMIAPIDLSPNYAGPTVAIIHTFSMTAAIGVSFLTFLLTEEGHTISNWNSMFLYTSIISLVTYLPFLMCGSTRIQSWNYFGLIGAPDFDYEEDLLRRTVTVKIKVKKDDKDSEFALARTPVIKPTHDEEEIRMQPYKKQRRQHEEQDEVSQEEISTITIESN